MNRGEQSLLILVGVALLGLAARQSLNASGDSSVAVLVIAGALLVICPFVLLRIEKIALSKEGFELTLTKSIAETGAPDTARRIESSGLAKYAEYYSFVHEDLSPPEYKNAKIYLQDKLVARAAALARCQKFDAAEVQKLFKNGTPLFRVLVLGLMKGDPSLVDGSTIESAVIESRTANEQYHGLQLADSNWTMLLPTARHRIVKFAVDDPRITPHSDRYPLTQKLRQRLDDEDKSGASGLKSAI